MISRQNHKAIRSLHTNLSRVLPVTLSILLAGCGINNIPTYDEAVNVRWSEVQSVYKRRAELVPNLLSIVEAGTEQQSLALSQITEAHTRVTQMDIAPDMLTNADAFRQFQNNQGLLTAALQQLMMLTDTLPELQSNENLQIVQQELENTENRITVARRDYIAAAQQFNTELKTIPGRWWVSFMYPNSNPKAQFSSTTDDTTNAATNLNRQ